MSQQRLHVVFGLGPVGLAVVRSLLTRGERVRVVVSRPGSRDLDPRVEVDVGDATNVEQTRLLCAGASHVYQCTNARDYHRWPEQFPPLQRGILAGAAANDATLVVLENFYVYGAHGGTPMSEDDPLLGAGQRASTRIAMTRELEAAHARGVARVVRVRAADLIGPYVRQSMAGADLLEPILRGARKVRLFGDLDVPHALADVDDVGEALVNAGLDREAEGRVLHAPCAPAITPRLLVHAIAEEAGVATPRIEAAPRWALPMLLPIVGALTPTLRGIEESTWMFYEPFEVDARRYVRRYGVDATPLGVTIARTVAWYRATMRAAA